MAGKWRFFTENARMVPDLLDDGRPLVLIQRVATGPRIKWLAAGWLAISNWKLCKKTVSCFECFLCLSRACLGKKIIFLYKWFKKTFLPAEIMIPTSHAMRNADHSFLSAFPMFVPSLSW